MEEKRKKLQAELTKQLGKGAIKTADQIPATEFVKSGIPMVDWSFTGGLPRGRVVEFWGPNRGGKTSLGSLFIAGEQQYQASLGDEARDIHYFDKEHTYDLPWTRKLGVDNSKLILIREGWDEKTKTYVEISAEDVFNHTLLIARSGLSSLIFWDSLPSFKPKAKLKADDANKQTPGGLAAIMSNNMPELVAALDYGKCTLVIINQYREKIGVMYGSPATRPGGEALNHYATQIAYVRVGDSLEEKTKDDDTGAEDGGKVRIGNESRIQVQKNKVGPAYREATVAYLYDYGVDRVGAVVDMALQLRIVEQGGRFYRHEAFTKPDLWVSGEELVNVEKGYVEGKDRVYQLAYNYPDFYELLRSQVDAKINS